MSSLISVQLDAVADLATELAALADELADEGRLCASVAPRLGESLAGVEGWVARGVAADWSMLIGLVAEQADAVARTLRSAVDAYRAADEAIGDRLCPADPDYSPR